MEGRALPGGEDGNSREKWGQSVSNRPPAQRGISLSCPGVQYPSAGTLNCISSPLWGPVQPEEDGLWTQIDVPHLDFVLAELFFAWLILFLPSQGE